MDNQIIKRESRELQLIEQKPSKSGEVGQFLQALAVPKVNTCDEEDIKQVLRLIMLKLGIREKNLPGEDEKRVLLDHIALHYGNDTIAEIRLAFEMAIAGKLDCEANCYENFSCAYVSTIMNAYRHWASQTYNQEVKGLPDMVKNEPEPDPISDEEIIDISRNVYRTTKNYLFISSRVYHLLKLNPPEEQRELIRRQAVAQIEEMLKTDRHLFGDIPREKYLNNVCKKISVANYFDNEAQPI